MEKVIKLVKREIVLIISAVLATVSIILVPPSAHYFGYVDYSVIGILFCLMIAVDGFMELGVLDIISTKLITKAKNTKTLSAILVNCVFFSSVLFTNDVALIAFVPISKEYFILSDVKSSFLQWSWKRSPRTPAVC